jgi:effector-binding domain-containing protein
MSTPPRLSVELKTTDAACVAYIPMTGPYAQIPAAMERLYGWVAGRGLAPAGMPSGVYLTDPAQGEEAARWELHAPLAGDHPDAPVDASGCGIKHVAPHLVTSANYRGPYDRIAPAYAEIAEWIRTNGYAVSGPPEELYCSEPTTPPEDTLTEIRFPVAKAQGAAA